MASNINRNSPTQFLCEPTEQTQRIFIREPGTSISDRNYCSHFCNCAKCLVRSVQDRISQIICLKQPIAIIQFCFPKACRINKTMIAAASSISKSKSSSNFSRARGFSRAARCTNASAFDLAPIASGIKSASELGFPVDQISKS